jgi:hypothetical protein
MRGALLPRTLYVFMALCLLTGAVWQQKLLK